MKRKKQQHNCRILKTKAGSIFSGAESMTQIFDENIHRAQRFQKSFQINLDKYWFIYAVRFLGTLIFVCILAVRVGLVSAHDVGVHINGGEGAIFGVSFICVSGKGAV